MITMRHKVTQNKTVQRRKMTKKSWKLPQKYLDKGHKETQINQLQVEITNDSKITTT